MSAEYAGPRIGDQAVAFTPVCDVVELAARDGIPGAVLVDNQGVRAWVPLSWISLIHDRRPGVER